MTTAAGHRAALRATPGVPARFVGHPVLVLAYGAHSTEAIVHLTLPSGFRKTLSVPATALEIDHGPDTNPS